MTLGFSTWHDFLYSLFKALGWESLWDVPSGQLRRTGTSDHCRRLRALALVCPAAARPPVMWFHGSSPPRGFGGPVVFASHWSAWAFLTLSPPESQLPWSSALPRWPVLLGFGALVPWFADTALCPLLLSALVLFCSVSSSVSWQTCLRAVGSLPGLTLLARPHVIQPGSLVTEASMRSRGGGLCGLLLI